MPIYVYKCNKCGEFEAQQSINDEAYKICPKCHDSKIRRQVTNTSGVIIKSSRYKNSSNVVSPQCEGCSKVNECNG